MSIRVNDTIENPKNIIRLVKKFQCGANVFFQSLFGIVHTKIDI